MTNNTYYITAIVNSYELHCDVPRTRRVVQKYRPPTLNAMVFHLILTSPEKWWLPEPNKESLQLWPLAFLR